MTNFLHALHEPGGEHLMGDKPGWIVFTERIFHDPSDLGGSDYRQWSDAGFGVIVRLNNDYHPGGTIPLHGLYADFAQRCANFVAGSQGANIWIIGNEPNLGIERPRGQVITPEMYVECFDLCAAAILSVQSGAIVCPAAIGPWNIQSGDWLYYFEYVLLNASNIGGICLHTYTHGTDPSLVTSKQTMDAPFDDRWYQFRAYRDFMTRVPADFYDLPFYITETDQNEPWQATGWIEEAYAEVDGWNREGKPYIHCLALFRWPVTGDGYNIDGKPDVQAEFRRVVEIGYTIPKEEEPPVSENLLVNGGMEHPYEYQKDQWGHDIVTVHKPHGWTAYWFGVMPEYKAVESIYPDRIHSGATAAQWFKNYDTPNGGLYQVVAGLEPGATYRLTGWAQFWAVYKNGNDVPASIETRINPYGSTNVDDPANIRSQPIHPHNAYQPFNALEFVASSDRATVFVVAIFTDPGQDMNAYIDTFELVRVGDLPDPPDPGPDPDPPADCDMQALYTALAAADGILEEAYRDRRLFFEALANDA